MELWLQGSFHYFLAKDLGWGWEVRRGGGGGDGGELQNLSGWLPSVLFFFLSEPCPHTLPGCLPQRLFYYSYTSIFFQPHSLHTLSIPFDFRLMFFCYWLLRSFQHTSHNQWLSVSCDNLRHSLLVSVTFSPKRLVQQFPFTKSWKKP